MITVEQAYLWLAQIVLWASVLALLLPRVDRFNDFPKFQKFYKTVVSIVSDYAALNIRSKLGNGNGNGNGNVKP